MMGPKSRPSADGLQTTLRYLARWFGNAATKSHLLVERKVRHRLSTGNKNPRSDKPWPWLPAEATRGLRRGRLSAGVCKGGLGSARELEAINLWERKRSSQIHWVNL